MFSGYGLQLFFFCFVFPFFFFIFFYSQSMICYFFVTVLDSVSFSLFFFFLIFNLNFNFMGIFFLFETQFMCPEVITTINIRKKNPARETWHEHVIRYRNYVYKQFRLRFQIQIRFGFKMKI